MSSEKKIDLQEVPNPGWYANFLKDVTVDGEVMFPLTGTILIEYEEEDFNCPKCGDVMIIKDVGKIGVDIRCNGADCPLKDYLFYSELLG